MCNLKTNPHSTFSVPSPAVVDSIVPYIECPQTYGLCVSLRPVPPPSQPSASDTISCIQSTGLLPIHQPSSISIVSHCASDTRFESKRRKLGPSLICHLYPHQPVPSAKSHTVRDQKVLEQRVTEKVRDLYFPDCALYLCS